MIGGTPSSTHSAAAALDAAAAPAPSTGGGRLLVVSNRLPVTLARDAESGEWKATMSSGGLVSALSGLKRELEFTWIGWPGAVAGLTGAEQERVRQLLINEHRCVPVFLPEQIADLHYNGFSNSILWPLLHYCPGEIAFREDQWDAYHAANVMFADAVLEHLQDGDMVWVQDYHLMLLPALLRAKCADQFPHIKLGFFLHTPFPSSEIYRILPVRREILLGILECDVVGFHTWDYARHFLSSCTRILGLSTLPNGVEYEGRMVHVGTFPIGIDPDQFIAGLAKPAVQDRLATLRSKFQGVKMIVGVDRLDYIKGVPLRLLAFEVFLSQHPEWIGKCVLVQVAVPSRTDVDEYQQLRSTVNELVGRINGQYGTVEFMPIHLLNKSVQFDELVALYAAADVCVVSSTRDGMNLVCGEYVAAQRDGKGVLIMSEFAGAAQSLDGSILVNPWNTGRVGAGLPPGRDHGFANARREPRENVALRRVGDELDLRMRMLPHLAPARVLASMSSSTGAAAVSPVSPVPLPRLAATKSKDLLLFAPMSPSPTPSKSSTNSAATSLATARRMLRDHALRPFTAANLRVLFLDLGGTLTPGDRVLPDFAHPPAHVLDLLYAAARLPNTAVYLMSGRARRHLGAWLARETEDVGIGVIAEHGCFFRHPPNRRRMRAAVADPDGWVRLATHVDGAWRETIRPLFQHYTDRTPGSFIEDKEVNLSWHYRLGADPEFGAWQAAELQVNVEKMLAHLPVTIVLGNKSLELRPANVDKASAVRSILRDLDALAAVEGQSNPSRYVLAVGDGKTDEVVFTYLAAGGGASTLATPAGTAHASPTGDDANRDSTVAAAAVSAAATGQMNTAVTITVGKKQTAAKYFVDAVVDVHALLALLPMADADPALVAEDGEVKGSSVRADAEAHRLPAQVAS
ncbi:alpha,alpha-trehalose-phosphate synthase (UDP-forming) [Allomyces macrogynus ATCC 38327]|uniref:Alpha,alpha-trehalose-phosphate synthase (UDP-forming) n=1 Tax=Allomyces macrogynus (strain ATCC 38327) TaxID=578462 RepID=A0A0L0TD15_ALLM3|nr:alpha,alpha-trehalose-phosphate synthase (UDP-forming) [Allomyces macrogynus ATCC 38327]|eukprot:KNE72419.1 alpha,alpha-trehalose-phosphate synthase (UDP-forming) [Allomyces macrogynus ATCC 38327]